MRIACIFLMGIILITGCVSQQEGQIKIGFIGPLSGEGANFGLPARNTFEMAISEANERAGWEKFKAIYEDGKCTGRDANTAAQKLIFTDKVSALLVVCAAETQAVAPVIEENKIIMIDLDTNPSISGRYKYAFRNAYSDEEIAKIAAEVISRNSSKAGVIYEITAYPVGLKDAFRRHFEALNGSVFEEGYEQNSKDMRTQLTKIISQNPDIVFVNPDTTGTGIAALQQLRQLGFKGQIYGNYFGSGSDVVQASEAEGMIFFSDPAVSESTKKKNLFEKYEVSYGGKPDFEYWAAASYDGANVLIRAVENAGNDPEKMREFIANSSFSGVLGDYRFDENNDMRGPRPSVNIIINKTIMGYEL